jgi:hypothetical protein
MVTTTAAAMEMMEDGLTAAIRAAVMEGAETAAGEEIENEYEARSRRFVCTGLAGPYILGD